LEKLEILFALACTGFIGLELKSSLDSLFPLHIAMSNLTIDKVLQCQNLPSLPGVAMRVLELTQSRSVSAQEIASTIQTDAALTTKVLRTINSSFYALPTPCPSIKRATSLLGLNTVKSIVLGFSLVESTRRSGLDSSFDMLAYWRRAVHSAAGARLIAQNFQLADPDEAFIGAMVQDIGVLAFAATLRGEYDRALVGAGLDHERHSEFEFKNLQVDHMEVGALLAERWRLPPQIIECIRWHHQPDGCSPLFAPLLKCVTGGIAAAAVLNAPEPDKRKLGNFVVRMRQDHGLDATAARELLIQINEAANQLSQSMELKTGESADTSRIMSMAHEAMIATQQEIEREAVELRQRNENLERKNATDALTGAFNRSHFDRELLAAFDEATKNKSPLTVLFSDADKFKSVNDTHGHQAGDAVLIELAKRLGDALIGVGIVCRYGGEEFAIIVPGADAARGSKVAELLRRRIAVAPFDITIDGTTKLSLPVTISLGVATHHAGSETSFTNHEQLVHAADLGVYAAKQAGRNCVRVGSLDTPKVAGAAIRVLAVEDDPLAARLLGFVFDKRREFALTFCVTGEEALDSISGRDEATRPQLVLCDLNLPGISGIEVVEQIRANPLSRHILCVMLSATSDPKVQQAAINAGATFFIQKSDFCGNFDKWVDRLLALVHAAPARIAA